MKLVTKIECGNGLRPRSNVEIGNLPIKISVFASVQKCGVLCYQKENLSILVSHMRITLMNSLLGLFVPWTSACLFEEKQILQSFWKLRRQAITLVDTVTVFVVFVSVLLGALQLVVTVHWAELGYISGKGCDFSLILQCTSRSYTIATWTLSSLNAHQTALAIGPMLYIVCQIYPVLSELLDVQYKAIKVGSWQ